MDNILKTDWNVYVISLALLMVNLSKLAATTYVFNGTEDSLYTNINNWQSMMMAPDPISASDTVIISAGVYCRAESSIINRGTFINQGTFAQPTSTMIIWHRGTVYNQDGAHFNSNFVQMADTAIFNNAVNATFENTGVYFARSSTFNNWGTIQNRAGAEFLNKNPNRPVPTMLNNFGTFQNESGAIFENIGACANEGTFHNHAGAIFESFASFTSQGIFENNMGAIARVVNFNNEGLFNNHDSLIVSSWIDNHGNFNNYAVVITSSSAGKIRNYSTLNNFTGSEMQLGLENYDSSTLDNQAVFTFNTFLNDTSSKITNTGTMSSIGTGSLWENLGEIVNNGYLSFSAQGCINRGIISGNGIFGPDLIFAEGCIKPGSSLGKIKLEGRFQSCYQACTDRYVLEIGGDNQNDSIISSGEAQIGAILEIKLINNFVPNKCQEFVVLTYDSLSDHHNSFDSLIAPDISPFAWKLVYTDTAAIVKVEPGNQDNALAFDGVDDYISVSDAINAVHTIEFLFNPLLVDPDFIGDPLLNFNSETTQWIWTMDVTSNVSDETLSIQNGGSYGNNLLFTKYRFSNDWYHVAIVSDGQFYKKMYINGEEVPSFTGTGGTYPPIFLVNSMVIGARLVGSAHFFAGSLEDLRLWSSVRTPEEIRTSYLKDLNGEFHLSAYYKMDQGIAGGDHGPCDPFILMDSGAQGRHGIFHGFEFVGNSSNWIKGCVVEENIFTGTLNNSWYQPTNWSLGVVPQICHKVLIPAQMSVILDVDIPARCHSIEIAGTSELTMVPNIEFEVLSTGL